MGPNNTDSSDHPVPVFLNAAAATALTHLDLSCTGLRGPAFDGVVQSMMCLTRLKALNLSWNVIDRRQALTLIAALASCTALETLDLDHTMVNPPHGACWLPDLAAAVPSFPHLHTLRVGGIDGSGAPSEFMDQSVCSGLAALLQSLRSAATLRTLGVRLTLPEAMPGKTTIAVFGALSKLTQLHCLCLKHAFLAPAAAAPRSGPAAPPGGLRAMPGPSQASLQTLLGRSVAKLSHLTALAIGAQDVGVLHQTEAKQTLALLEHLKSLLELRRLEVELHCFTHTEAAALAASLRVMTRLTKLELTVMPMAEEEVHWELATVVTVAEAALGLPQLRELRLPVSTTWSAAGALVPLVHAATQIDKLSLDAFGDVRTPDSAPPADAVVEPLLQHVTAAYVTNTGPPPWLQPFGAQLAAMTNLRVLHIQVNGTCGSAAVEALACVWRLTLLDALSISMVVDESCVTAMRAASRDMARLTGLTSLRWCVAVDGDGALASLPDVAACCAAAPGLRELEVRVVLPVHLDAYCCTLPQVALAKLVLGLYEPSMGDRVAEMIKRMPSLRAVGAHIATDGAGNVASHAHTAALHSQIRDAVEGHFACDLLF